MLKSTIRNHFTVKWPIAMILLWENAYDFVQELGKSVKNCQTADFRLCQVILQRKYGSFGLLEGSYHPYVKIAFKFFFSFFQVNFEQFSFWTSCNGFMFFLSFINVVDLLFNLTFNNNYKIYCYFNNILIRHGPFCL